MIGLLLFLGLKKQLEFGYFLLIAGAFYLVAVALNPFLYRYHYVVGFLSLSLGIAMWIGQDIDRETEKETT